MDFDACDLDIDCDDCPYKFDCPNVQYYDEYGYLLRGGTGEVLAEPDVASLS